MTLAARRHVTRFPTSTADSRPLPTLLAAGMLVAASVHVVLAIEHSASIFAALSIAVAIVQGALGAGALLHPSQTLYRACIVVSLMMIQLYVLNVTVGLPPFIAHTHVAGTHSVAGLTLAWPNSIDLPGVLAQCSQLLALFAASMLGRTRTTGRQRPA